MKLLKIVSVIPFLAILLFFTCKKEEPDSNGSNTPLTFTSLLAEKDTIPSSGTIKVTAVASGDDLNFTWKATAGDISGSGAVVTYSHSGTPLICCGNCSAATCCGICNKPGGLNIITCMVEDANNNSETKSIIIVVLL